MLCSTNTILFLGALTVAVAIPTPNPNPGVGLPLGFLNPFDERPRPQNAPQNIHHDREDFENVGTEDDLSDDISEEGPGGDAHQGQQLGTDWVDPSSQPGGQMDTRPMHYLPPAGKLKNGVGQSFQYTDSDAQGDWNGTMEAKIFGTPLTHDQYYARNFLWIRCRTTNALNFDVGGSWAGPWGEYWKRALEEIDKCTLINWHFSYVNGKDWGDAIMGANWFEPWCSLSNVVDAAIDVSRTIAYFMKRELYIYSCPGYEELTNYFNEPAEWDKYSRGKNPAFANAKGKGKGKKPGSG